jgi:hypothetical protein
MYSTYPYPAPGEIGDAVKEGSRSYRLVDDLDGNPLFFNYPKETASREIAGDEA